MDTHADIPEDMNALERRLAAWQPSSAGLDADSLLFAAGRASVRPGTARFIWPTLTAVLTVLAVVLGLQLAEERSERLALVRQLREQPSAPIVSSPPPPIVATAPAESPHLDELAPDSYLASHRALELGLDAWPSRAMVRVASSDPSPINPPILTLGQRDALLDQRTPP